MRIRISINAVLLVILELQPRLPGKKYALRWLTLCEHKWLIPGERHRHVILEANQVTNPAGYSVGSGMDLDFIVPPDKVGMFVRRQQEGAGLLAATNVQAVWNFASNNLSRNSRVIMQAFGVEMVYVAEGAFYAGDGGSGSGRFIAGGTANDPFLVDAAWNAPVGEGNARAIGNVAGQLWGASTAGNNSIGGAGTLSNGFPTGYEAFYCMKYEITEGAWVDFFNNLDNSQKAARNITDSFGKNTQNVLGRNTVGWMGGTNLATTAAKDRACNFLSWADVAAFMVWAGLRPMTELEFEKAFRGPLYPEINEFAWGENSSQFVSGPQGTDGSGTEYYTTGNAHFEGNGLTGGQHGGPIRVGIFAKQGAGRAEAGASYWGIMEMSGNLMERAVTVGNATGRSFSGNHGNGVLTELGDADVVGLSWPALNGSGVGKRGGNFFFGSDYIRVSDRTQAVLTTAVRKLHANVTYGPYGGRAVRTAP